jgi:hypothetical protein
MRLTRLAAASTSDDVADEVAAKVQPPARSR